MWVLMRLINMADPRESDDVFFFFPMFVVRITNFFLCIDAFDYAFYWYICLHDRECDLDFSFPAFLSY